MKKLDSGDWIKYVFIAVVALEIVSRAMGWEKIGHMTKPLLMPILLVYFRKGTTGPMTLSFLFGAGGLMFSFAGDALLMFTHLSELYFMLGLGAFAIAHILYVLAFSKAVDLGSEPMSKIQKFLFAIPFLIYLGIMLNALMPGVGSELKIPVVAYMFVIISMTLSAVYRNGRADQVSINQVILGAIFFVLSDTLLAMNKFYFPMENAGIWVMLTYVLAQWNIVNGLQKHYNK
ncbi:MAG: lysoplasmalogenase [Reichenbachiella sp.]